eukprot:135228-Pyramimonas_sp.AAC.1
MAATLSCYDYLHVPTSAVTAPAFRSATSFFTESTLPFCTDRMHAAPISICHHQRFRAPEQKKRRGLVAPTPLPMDAPFA